MKNLDVDAAETNFAVVKEHIKQQGSVDMLSLKVGPPGVGKTTTLWRFLSSKTLLLDVLFHNSKLPWRFF